MGNIILFSDLHANFFAVRYMESWIRAADDVWALGDFFGRGPHIRETADFVQEYLSSYKNWVLGNHDAYVFDLIDDDTKRKFKPSTAKSLDCHRRAIASYNGSLKEHFSVPERAALRWVDDDVALVHSTPLDPIGISPSVTRPYDPTGILVDKFINPFLKNAEKRKGKKVVDAILFCGHSHLPFFINWHPERGLISLEEDISYGKMVSIPSGITIINPGSVGNPRLGSHTFVEFDRTQKAVAFHAFRLSRRCKNQIGESMDGYGKCYETDIRLAFRNPPDTEKIKAEEPAYYEILERRESAHSIPETGNELCFR